MEVRVFNLTSFLRRSLESFCVFSHSALRLEGIVGRFCEP